MYDTVTNARVDPSAADVLFNKSIMECEYWSVEVIIANVLLVLPPLLQALKIVTSTTPYTMHHTHHIHHTSQHNTRVQNIQKRN